jgi:hypothetical protein
VVFSTPLPSRIFDLILSFPLLEDLAVVTRHGHGRRPEEDEVPTAAQPSNPLMFTGSLELHLGEGMESFVRQLLSLPGGIHFRKLIWTWSYGNEPPLMMALAEGCSHTLEALNINWNLLGASALHLRPH